MSKMCITSLKRYHSIYGSNSVREDIDWERVIQWQDYLLNIDTISTSPFFKIYYDHDKDYSIVLIITIMIYYSTKLTCCQIYNTIKQKVRLCLIWWNDWCCLITGSTVIDLITLIHIYVLILYTSPQSSCVEVLQKCLVVLGYTYLLKYHQMFVM